MSTRAAKRKEATVPPSDGAPTENSAVLDITANKRVKSTGEGPAADVNATTTEETAAAVITTTKHTKPPRSVNTGFPSHLSPADPSHFDQFLFQLLAFRAETNSTNFNVHKDEYPILYAWLQFIKKEYKNFSSAAPSHLTAQQVAVLESLHVPLTSRGDEHWNRFYELLVDYKGRHGHVLVPRLCEVPGLGDWVTDQRRQYKAKQQGQATQLSDSRQAKLEALDFVWHVRNRPEWEVRYTELLEYKDAHGDCKVPQHYKPNKALGKWVAKQREQYKLQLKGKHSFLTPYRLEKLNVAGFVWQVRSALESEVETVIAETAAPAAAAPAAAEGPVPGAQAEAVDADFHDAVEGEMNNQQEVEAVSV